MRKLVRALVACCAGLALAAGPAAPAAIAQPNGVYLVESRIGDSTLLLTAGLPGSTVPVASTSTGEGEQFWLFSLVSEDRWTIYDVLGEDYLGFDGGSGVTLGAQPYEWFVEEVTTVNGGYSVITVPGTSPRLVLTVATPSGATRPLSLTADADSDAQHWQLQSLSR
ncbi:hypothetical protein KCV87_03090 [Actinosynnema pretiosum subsp. pretiosum]|uniref:Ricin B lectin n=2 Tax=Actinosynnema TaxID=40566 RepID=C6W9S7_ACTMD|nr:hypothetical protein [Actinosynnema mirum]ACU37294.1 hypothetical protein Amir_3396 [Actinosynnema mirum DSM 43827]QUF05117.1 hypothetical protein KCV87_03090 [Actinosynnema pretiosum subsp. pretiosum]